MNTAKLKEVAAYILETEFDNYVEWCEENCLKPENLEGMTGQHVYAMALLGLGLKFEAEETE